jgi:hypothetical protein
MRRERFNLEEQVGGLVDHGSRWHRRRSSPVAPTPEPVEPERYPLTPRGTLAIRASRAAGEPSRRAEHAA